MSFNIYIGNMSFDTSEAELREVFETYGAVETVNIVTDRDTGRPRGFGFVEMTERDDGMKAIQELDSSELGGRSLKVNEAKPRRDSRDRGNRGGGGGSRW